MARDLVLEQRWRERIKERRQSGLTVKGWCLQKEYYGRITMLKSSMHKQARDFSINFV